MGEMERERSSDRKWWEGIVEEERNLLVGK